MSPKNPNIAADENASLCSTERIVNLSSKFNNQLSAMAAGLRIRHVPAALVKMTYNSLISVKTNRVLIAPSSAGNYSAASIDWRQIGPALGGLS